MNRLIFVSATDSVEKKYLNKCTLHVCSTYVDVGIYFAPFRKKQIHNGTNDRKEATVMGTWEKQINTIYFIWDCSKKCAHNNGTEMSAKTLSLSRHQSIITPMVHEHVGRVHILWLVHIFHSTFGIATSFESKTWKKFCDSICAIKKARACTKRTVFEFRLKRYDKMLSKYPLYEARWPRWKTARVNAWWTLSSWTQRGDK